MRQSLRHGGYLRLCLLRSHARLEPHETFNPARAAVFEFVSPWSKSLLHRHRDPELHCPADEGAIEAFRRNADDRVRHTIEHLRFADNRRIAMEPLFPHLIADHRYGMSVTPRVFGGFEPPPQ